MKTTNDTLRLLIGQIAFVALLLCSIGLAVILSGCGSVPKFPAQYIYEVDIKAGVCGQYKIVDPQKFQVVHVKDYSLSKCNGVFGFSSQDIPKVLDWCSDVVQIAKNKCQQ